MKEILDNWKQFINEQAKFSPEERLDAVIRYAFGLDAASDDKKWKKIKKIASNFNLKKASDSFREKFYYTFDSENGENSFVRMIRQIDNKRLPIDAELRKAYKPNASDEEIKAQYRKIYLPKIKKIIDKVSIINLASDLAAQLYPSHVEEVAKSLQKGKMIGGFFAERADGKLGFIGINLYAQMNREGMINFRELERVVFEELAHAVDLSIGMPFSSMLDKQLKGITKAQKDTDIKSKDYYDYLKDPVEIYAKLKVIKSELMKIDSVKGGRFFDERGEIRLDQLKDYLEDPKSRQKHRVIRILNIQKAEDIGKVLNQIARVDRQKTSQMA